MAEYEAPGVYVEETPRGFAAAIVGVDASTLGLVGPVARVPDGGPPAIESFATFEAIYGGIAEPVAGAAMPFVAQAARAFFANGGRRLLVAPVAATATPADRQAALDALRDMDVGILAAPGAEDAEEAARDLCAHVQVLGGTRFAILDPPAGLDIAGIRAFRAAFECNRAALYYPWVQAADAGGRPILLPPSGFMAGIYARVDATRGIFKAPANEVLTLATGLERRLNQDERALLNPLGIDCIAAFPGRGILAWGARTVSSNAEWRYVSVRRYVGYIEESIRQWLNGMVFEPNVAATWTAVTAGIANFLTGEWRQGGLAGSRANEAFAVRCGLGVTMTPSDILDGKLRVEVMLAPVRPAEFIVVTLVLELQPS